MKTVNKTEVASRADSTYIKISKQREKGAWKKTEMLELYYIEDETEVGQASAVVSKAAVLLRVWGGNGRRDQRNVASKEKKIG